VEAIRKLIRAGAGLALYSPVISIIVTAEAFEAIAATLPFGNVGFERELDANGGRQIWLERRILDRLRAMHQFVFRSLRREQALAAALLLAGGFWSH
jgi:hypothetical protein